MKLNESKIVTNVASQPIDNPFHGRDVILYNRGNRPIYFGFEHSLTASEGAPIYPGRYARLGFEDPDHTHLLYDLRVVCSHGAQELILMWIWSGMTFELPE